MFAVFVYVPVTHEVAVRKALHDAGAGAIGGSYDCCSFTGTGRFRPLTGANPAIGTVGKLEPEEVAECRIETVVTQAGAAAAIAAVKASHPYEEPGIHLLPLVDYRQFLSATAPRQSKGVCIVLEGLDGVGKSTVSLALAKRVGAVHMITPTPRMREFRPFFDSPTMHPLTRHGYYMTGNFMAGQDMRDAVESGASVVLDRYYASTLSYVLGKSGEVPPAGDSAYDWPAALPRADCMVLLTLPEAVRIQRRAGRLQVEETEEEALLARHAEVSARINEAFRRFGCVDISAEGSVEEIVDRIMDLPVLRRLGGCTASS